MRSCAIHVHKHSVEAMLLQQCREVTAVILSITPWLATYMGQSLIRCNILSSIIRSDFTSFRYYTTALLYTLAYALVNQARVYKV